MINHLLTPLLKDTTSDVITEGIYIPTKNVHTEDAPEEKKEIDAIKEEDFMATLLHESFPMIQDRLSIQPMMLKKKKLLKKMLARPLQEFLLKNPMSMNVQEAENSSKMIFSSSRWPPVSSYACTCAT